MQYEKYISAVYLESYYRNVLCLLKMVNILLFYAYGMQDWPSPLAKDQVGIWIGSGSDFQKMKNRPVFEKKTQIQIRFLKNSDLDSVLARIPSSKFPLKSNVIYISVDQI